MCNNHRRPLLYPRQTERNDGGGRLTPLVPRPPLRFHAAYVNRGGAWNDFNRNWTVAEPSMIRLVDELDFFIATIDREPSHTALSQLASLGGWGTLAGVCLVDMHSSSGSISNW